MTKRKNLNGKIGTSTSIIIKPKIAKIPAKCSCCYYFKNKRCSLNRKSGVKSCKWYSPKNDYRLSAIEKKKLKTKKKYKRNISDATIPKKTSKEPITQMLISALAKHKEYFN